MRVSIDAMGGDYAPENIVLGAIMALKDIPVITRLHLVGDQKRIEQELARHAFADSRLTILHASQVIGMDESAIQGVRRKKDSSMTRAIDLVREGQADIIVSAGNTGALFTAAHLKLRTLEGVDRPGLACVMPSREGRFILMDAGANLEPRPEHLLQYAYMGSLYAREIFGVPQPRVGLFSIGTEDMKGNELVLNAHKLLKASSLNFVGNLDGHEIFSDKCDVLIADAFVGNAILKTAESTARAMGHWLKRSLSRNPLSRLGAAISKAGGAFAHLRSSADPDVFGGAVMLGINGLCFKSHGSASPLAIRNTISRAIEFGQDHFNTHIVEALQTARARDEDFPSMSPLYDGSAAPVAPAMPTSQD
ncbi:MAG: phosphate acyltransferase PlsX [Verrucomicrobiae bacterium]|nr:phosphate acyltransferase PlsX [Verrucomicrobiae bacterium]